MLKNEFKLEQQEILNFAACEELGCVSGKTYIKLTCTSRRKQIKQNYRNFVQF
jgi:hypothetical protein